MPPKARKPGQKPVAPLVNAPIEEQKKHAEEVLADEDYKKKPDDYQDLNDEANP